ncbi:hypothetical protein CMUS01_06403 [Colletotrichum musicola]|uniref:Uncharacterized protein n=1 Tax=Colletotrichum musicola TaxID=2175873 RepID=A0A8H6KLL6_9PEZI|nr:hypothetical protein CMUS01_06403 [Colletotrichum musicola]
MDSDLRLCDELSHSAAQAEPAREGRLVTGGLLSLVLVLVLMLTMLVPVLVLVLLFNTERLDCHRKVRDGSAEQMDGGGKKQARGRVAQGGDVEET